MGTGRNILLITGAIFVFFCTHGGSVEECQFDGLNDRKYENSKIHSLRLAEIANLFYKTEFAHGANPSAMIELFKSRELLPENGVLHVVGPNMDFYEWLVPLMARSDIKIIVSEPDEIMELTVTEKGQLTAMTWKSLAQYNAKLLEKTEFDTPHGRKELQERVSKQVSFIADVGGKTFANGTPIPLADLIIARAPRKDSWGFDVQAKPGTLIWTVTERHNIGPQAMRLNTQLAEMLPPRDFENENRFKAMDLAIVPAFWIHE